MRYSKQACVLVIGEEALALANALLEKNTRKSITLFAASSVITTHELSPNIRSIQVDLSNEKAIQRLFEQLSTDGFSLELVIFNPKPATSSSTLGVNIEHLNQRWQHMGFSLFVIAQNAIKTMLKKSTGSLIVVGSELALKPQSPFSTDAAMYAGIRALSQSLAREFQPKGLHIAHIVQLYMDSPITSTRYSALATACWHLHQQPRQGWTHELIMQI